MGTITTGVGLASGIDYQSIVDQLMAIEARPKKFIEQRNVVLQSQQAAFQNINAKLLALQASTSSLTSLSMFNATAATSSDEDVLTITSGSTTTPGTYQFLVSQLVASQTMTTRGFLDKDTTPLGAGTLTFESAAARLDHDTVLSQLTFVGDAALDRGRIKITDRSGASATIDLTTVMTVSDVLNAINSEDSISVTASASGDALKITDTSGGVGNLIVANVGQDSTATSLGIAGSVAAASITGQQINQVTTDTLLSILNDGNGVRTTAVVGGSDFTITQSDAVAFNVALGDATTVGDVIDAINNATGNTAVTASINTAGTGIKLVDSAAGGGNFTVTAISSAAADLGLTSDANPADNTVEGIRLIAAINSRLIKSLNGTSTLSLGTLDITNRNAVATSVDLSGADSFSEVIDLINAAAAGVTASINRAGNGLLITDTTGGSNDLRIESDEGSFDMTADQLGFTTHVYSADSADGGDLELQYISEATLLSSLNGGASVATGQFTITISSGVSATIDIGSTEKTVGDVIREINGRFNTATQLEARINDTGDGILLVDKAGGGIAMTVEEDGSNTARDLGLLGEAETAGDNIDGSFETTITIDAVEAMTGATLLSALNEGEGIRVKSGSADFRVTARSGAAFDVNLDGLTTVDDVLNAINTAPGNASVTASINAAGTGLVLTDTSVGGVLSVIALNTSNAATDLGILGSDADGTINGSAIVGVVTLKDLVDRINDSNAGVRATVLDTGALPNGQQNASRYRLSLTAADSGSAGAFIFDDGALDLQAKTQSDAKDAVVFYGDPARNGVAISSSTNTISVLPGATITLKGTSDSLVSVTVSRDNAGLGTAVSGFVDSFNDLITTIEGYDSYDSETEQRGLLLGDSTVATISRLLFNTVINRNSELTSQYTRLSQIGITVGSGSQLEFDQAKFEAALEADRDAVQALLTYKVVETDDDGATVFNDFARPVIESGGVGVRLEELINRLVDSTLQNRVDGISDQIDLNTDRIEQMDVLLAAKRERMLAQFIAMEQAISAFSAQGSALNSLALLVSNNSSSQ